MRVSGYKNTIPSTTLSEGGFPLNRYTTAFVLTALLSPNAFAVNPDADTLLGIHWYPNTDSISVGQPTDVEAMSSNEPVWVTEITHVDAADAPPWDQPGYFVNHSQKVMSGKGHSVIFRMQPYWSRNVPHPDDPYTLSDYANDAEAAANTLKDYVHIWQIGNEVNIIEENKKWNTSTSDYDINWEPAPADYAQTYITIRDAIHEVAPSAPLGDQIVLMQPVSPGPDDAFRYMDGNEFLYRMIDAVPDKSKIDGFALHSYAEPGGANYGIDGYMDALTEQLAIIDAFGLSDRPIYVTEFNKHMPNSAEANIGAKFLYRSYQAMNDWNNGTGGLWPGQPNHNIISATWFVYPEGGWQDYSLEYWKDEIASTDKELNPWYSFQHAAGLNLPAGAAGGGANVLPNTLWWEDDFSSLDTTSGPPDWYDEPVGGGSAAAGSGGVRLLGNNSSFGGASLQTRGYVYSDFRAEAEFTVVNSETANGSPGEANFDIRIREGSSGYSLSFYTDGSNTRAGEVWLRRTNNWSENIDGLNASIPGGISDGDQFHVVIVADGSAIDYEIYKNGGETPSVNWSVTDSGQAVGRIRLGSYNVNEVVLDHFWLGGVDWAGTNVTLNAESWKLY